VAALADTSFYFRCPDVDAAYEELRGMKQMDLRDPDGFLLCFQWPIQPVTAIASAAGGDDNRAGIDNDTSRRPHSAHR
jgi:hypothetical protein